MPCIKIVITLIIFYHLLAFFVRLAFSGLEQTCQPPKGKKYEILNLEPGKVVQRNGYKAAGHKLWGKTRIVVNFNTERLQLNYLLVPYGSKKMMRERIDLFVFSLVRTLR